MVEGEIVLELGGAKVVFCTSGFKDGELNDVDGVDQARDAPGDGRVSSEY